MARPQADPPSCRSAVRGGRCLGTGRARGYAGSLPWDAGLARRGREVMAADEERRRWMGRASCVLMWIYLAFFALFFIAIVRDPRLRSLLPRWLWACLRHARRRVWGAPPGRRARPTGVAARSATWPAARRARTGRRQWQRCDVTGTLQGRRAGQAARRQDTYGRGGPFPGRSTRGPVEGAAKGSTASPARRARHRRRGLGDTCGRPTASTRPDGLCA